MLGLPQINLLFKFSVNQIALCKPSANATMRCLFTSVIGGAAEVRSESRNTENKTYNDGGREER